MELRSSLQDAQNVMEYWGQDEEFISEVEKDPRSWLLWRQTGVFKPFPMDLCCLSLIVRIPFQTPLVHNLILALFGKLKWLLVDRWATLNTYTLICIKRPNPRKSSWHLKWLKPTTTGNGGYGMNGARQIKIIISFHNEIQEAFNQQNRIIKKKID